ncbi:hypothetical protein AAFF_G00201010 [Aldrovandia affinis]|uniref:Uncharacterized protein n=1 Tax=Aldrovandia affinis TaxID=143900 RepID=A0AAD7W5X2_9TELE|nr:hypothetical protein AAFF_G00201010 [Aldrovandia affinis]
MRELKFCSRSPDLHFSRLSHYLGRPRDDSEERDDSPGTRRGAPVTVHERGRGAGDVPRERGAGEKPRGRNCVTPA